MKQFILNDQHGYGLNVYLYEPIQEKKAIIQLLHGAGEHAGRYEEFATYLCAHGFIVIMHDQHGHGKTRSEHDSMVHFSDKHGDQLLLDGVQTVYNHATSIDPDLPLFIIAHSMGSFITRALLAEKKDMYHGVVLIGSPYIPAYKIRFAKVIGEWIKRFKGPKHISKFMTNLTQDKPYKLMRKSGLINERIEWVTSDKDKQLALRNDPLASKPFTISAQLDLMRLMLRAQAFKPLKHNASTHLVTILCGSEDALCSYGEAVRKLYHFFDKAGFTNINFKIYANARHELINEVIRDKVMHDIVDMIHREIH